MHTSHNASDHSTIEPSEIRYVKLGRRNAWARRSLDAGEIHFGHDVAPHDSCVRGEWDRVAQLLKEQGRGVGPTKHALNEVRDFYSLDEKALWITFADGHLWWAFAAPEVIWVGKRPDGGVRLRRTIDGWYNTDVKGASLRVEKLSSRLTQTANFRQTICRVGEREYLLRRINAAPEPVVIEGERRRTELIESASKLIQNLHWADFEVMVEIIFTRGGWHRRSVLGETMPDVDLVLEQPTMATTASVQIKSKAGQRELEDHIAAFKRNGGHDRTFFVCHSPIGTLSSPGEASVHVWTGEPLARAAVSAGLFDWLLEKAA